MKKIAYILTVAACFIMTAPAWADDFNDMVDKGNQAFNDGDFKTALEQYHQAEVERPETPELYYNIGSALYKEGKYEEAVDKLDRSFMTENIQYEADGLYNQGNVYYQMGDYQNAIMAYQKSLEINPEDIDAKYNLELSRKMLKEQMKPENQDQQDQQQQQQKQEQPEEDENSEDKQEQPQPQEDEEQNEQQQKQQPQEVNEDEMSKEDAERILNALKDDEKELQEEQQRFKTQGGYQGNDW